MLDPNQPSIEFEQLTNMLKEIEQTHKEVLSGMKATGFNTRYWAMRLQTVIHSLSH